MTDIPGRNEPDPKNLRQRSFQGGADGLPDASPEQIPPEYRDLPQGAGAGISGITHAPAVREGGARVRVTEKE